MKTIFILLIAFLSIYATCSKKKECINATYSFNGDFRAFPDKDSIRIGDSIVLEFNHSVNFIDLVNNVVVEFNGAQNLGILISLTEVLPLSETGANGSFNFRLLNGQLVNNQINPTQSKEYLFDEINSRYIFKLHLTAKKIGKYGITIGNAANVYTSKNKCAQAFFEFKFKETNQHFYLFNQWRPNIVLQEPGKSRVYYFEVY